MRKILIVIVLMFYFTMPASAAINLSISGAPDSVEADSQFPISFNLSQGATASPLVYLRVIFFKEGTTKYFGYTQNQKGLWVNSASDKSQFYELSVSPEGTASGKIYTKLDLSDSYFEGAGVYKIKLGRYTSSEDTSADWSNELETAITIKNTPTPSPSSSPLPSITPSPSPTSTPTPTPKPTIKPSPSPSPSPSPEPSVLDEGEVAGVATELDLSGYGESPSPSPTVLGATSRGPSLNQSRLRTVIYIGIGLILISVAGFFGYRKYLKMKEDSTDLLV